MLQKLLKKHRHALWQKEQITFFLSFFVFMAIFTIGAPAKSYAAPATTLNFQGRLLNNSGGLVPDGSYNIDFKLYTAASGGSAQWTETHTVTGTNPVIVRNGYFSVYLGDATSGTVFPGTIDWSQEQFMSMNVGGTSGTPVWDGEMSPRFKLTAVPYAFQAGAVTDAAGDAFTADDLIKKSPASVQALNAALAAIRLNQTGSGGLLQLQGSGTDVFSVSNTGATDIRGSVLARNSTDSAAAFSVQNAAGVSFIQVNTLAGTAAFGAAGTSGTTLQGGSGGIQITSGANINIGAVDTTGTLLVLDTKTSALDPPGTNGAMYYNSNLNKFRCHENGGWVDCIGGAPYTGTTGSYVSGAQNILSNQTATPLENMVFTSNTAVSTVAAVGGFTAPANGSFRSCLVMNTANITAGTLALRWRVNGVSVGSPACSMNNTSPTNRQSSTVLNPGVVTFQAGDVIDLAFNTSAAFAPSGSNDFTIYWTVEYAAGTGGATSGITLQDVYDQSLTGSILTTNNKDITFNLANTAIDSDFVVNIGSGSTSKLVVQDNGTDRFTVDAAGNVVAGAGLTVGNSSSTTAGTIRWTGTDFEGYDGANWVSLTDGSGGGGGGTNFVSRVKQVNESVISSIALQNDDELTFPIGPNEEWTYRFVVQANAAVAPDLRFAVAAPSGAVCFVSFSDPEGATSNGQTGCGVTSILIPGNAAPDLYEITGSVKNGATAGNVTLQWAQFVSNATNTIVYAGSYVQAVRSIGAGGSGQPFVQSGNSFGTTAVLGTSDSQGLSIITNNVERIGVTAAGATGITGSLEVAGLTTLASDAVADAVATGTTGTTSGTATNTTTLVLAADTFAVNDVVYINNAGQDYFTRITVDPGTGSYTISPTVSYDNAVSVTKYTVQNIGATTSDYASLGNRFFQGYFLGGVVIGAGTTTISDGSISSSTTLQLQSSGGAVSIGGGLSVAGVISGDGSALTNIDGSDVDGASITDLNATNITTGTVNDGRLSANVALLSGAQTFSGLKTFGAGLAVTAGDIAVTGDISATGEIAGATIVGNGAGVTDLNATNITTGTVNDGRLSANVALLNGGQTFSSLTAFGAGLSITGNTAATGDVTATGTIAGATVSGNGSALSSLNATNVSSGTLNDGRLSANVALLTGAQSFTGLKTFSSGLVLGQTTLTSNATVARAVAFPDEAGTVCLSSTNTCGFLRIAAGAMQTDATNNDVLAVNKTSATGNLIALQRSGGAVFTVANTGSLQIQSTTTAALDIRNVGGTSYFSVDTSTGAVRVGPAAADGVGVLFVLDTKNTAGDPTGVEGAQYYNSAQQQFRCFRDGRWETCGANPIDRAFIMNDEFMSGYTGGGCTTATAIIGDQNWTCFTSGTANTAYNIGTILPTANRPGIIRMTTAAANGNGFTMALAGNNSGSVVIAPQNRVKAAAGLGATITNNRLRIGLHNQTTTNAQPLTGVWWEADATTNANWRYCYGTGVAVTCVASSVAIAANTMYTLDILVNTTTPGSANITYIINGTAFTVTNGTIGTARVNPAISCFNSIAGARECYIDYYQFSGVSSTRR